MNPQSDSSYPEFMVVSRPDGVDLGGEDCGDATAATVELSDSEQRDFEEKDRQKFEAYAAIRSLQDAVTRPIGGTEIAAGDPGSQPSSVAPRPIVSGVPNLGRFEIREHLGSGGAGIVFRAFDPQLQREVALKIPRADIVFTKGSSERFFQEARLIAALDHANIIPVYEAGTVGAVRYMACGYCAGPSLAEWLRNRAAEKRPVSARLAARWVEMLAEAVQYAHQRGIIHRDLKPSNILLEPKPHASADEVELKSRDVPDFLPRISDFGIGKIVEGDISMTASGAIIGTPQYMSPEQAAGEDAGPLSDVYGLGAILYEMLSGRPPFPGTSTLEVLKNVCENEPVRPRVLNAHVPDDLQTICLKCLEKSPARRYVTAQHVADDLRRYLEDRPILARKSGIAQRAMKWARRRPASAALAIVLVVAVLLGGLGGWWHSVRLQSELDVSNELRTEAESRKQEAERERQSAVAARVEVEERERILRRQIAPSKIRVANESARVGDVKRAAELLTDVVQSTRNEFKSDFSWRYVYGLCREHEHEFAPGGGQVYMVAFSPDGKTLAVGSENGIVKLYDPQTGDEQGELRGHTSCLNTMVFFDEGRQLLTGSCDKTVRLWDVSSHRQSSVVWQGESNVHALALSPDGTHLVWGEDSGIRLWRMIPLTELSYARIETPYPKSVIGFAGSNNLLVSNGGSDDRLQFWEFNGTSANASAPRFVQSSSKPQIAVYPNGNLLAYGADQGAIRLVDMETWKEIGSLPVHWSDVQALAFSNDGRRLASAGQDQIIRVWDVPTRSLLTSMTGHRGRICSLAFSPDGQSLATASWDGTARTWRLQRQVGRRLMPSTGTTGRIAFTSDGRHLVSQNGDASVAVWDVQTWMKAAKIDGHTFAVGTAPVRDGLTNDQEAVIAVPGSTRVEIWSGDGTRRLADIDAELFGTGAYVSTVSMSARTPGLLTTGFGRTAVRDLQLRIPSGQAQAAGENSPGAVSEPEMYVAPARCWIPEQSSGTSCMALSPDASQAVIVRNQEALVTLWDVSTLEKASDVLNENQMNLSRLPQGAFVPTDSTMLLNGHVATVLATEFSPDGKLLATSSKDGSIRIWSTSTHENIHTLLGHAGYASTIAFSPDSRNLASAGEDGVVRVWDTMTGHEMLTLDDHDSPVRGVAFSPDGKLLVTASPGPDGAGELILWHAEDLSTTPVADGTAALPAR